MSKPCDSLEKELKTDSGNLSIRRQLIDCYKAAYVHSYSGGSAERKFIAKKHAEHVLWMVQHAPQDPFVRHPAMFMPIWDPRDHARVKSAWMDQLRVYANDLRVLLSAADFLNSSNLGVEADREKAGELLTKAHSLDPKNTEVCTTFAKVLEYKMHNASPAERRRLASQAIELREQAIDATPVSELYEQLKGLGRDALDCDNEVKAQMYAEKLLELSRDQKYWAADMAFHEANLTLGRIALRRGQLEEAKARLLEAGKLLPTASPMLPMAGPNMRLAKELLEKQEIETVLQYFDACQSFWPQKATLDEWRKTVREGRIPQFGVNLIF